MICPFCNEEAYKFSNGDWYCPHCNNGMGSSRRVPIKQTTGYIINSNKDLAIECLKEVRQDVLVDNCEDYSVDLNYLVELIDNKIKELEDNEK